MPINIRDTATSWEAGNAFHIMFGASISKEPKKLSAEKEKIYNKLLSEKEIECWKKGLSTVLCSDWVSTR